MRLRSRLVLTSLAASLPLAVALVWLLRASRTSHFDQMAAAEIRGELQGAGGSTCERDPAAWTNGFASARRPPPSLRLTLFTYDDSFAPTVDGAPAIDEASRARLLAGPGLAAQASAAGGTSDSIIRSGTAGPCAFVMIRREETDAPVPRPSVSFETVLAASIIALLAIVALALGPMVGRLRRLSRAMRLSALEHHERPVVVEGDDEIAEVARAYNEATQVVREHVRKQAAREDALRSFLANTTHDIGTPLTVLTCHLAELRKRLSNGEAADAGVVAAAMNETHYMASLIHNLGVAAKLDAGEPDLQLAPVDLGSVVERTILRHRPIAIRLGVSVEFAVPPDALVVPADLTLVERALGNLVYNAIRYNRPGGHVAVVLRGVPATFAIAVIDDGPGISAGDQRLLMSDPAPTPERGRHPDGGQGLGLRITRRIAELHEWQLVFVPTDEGLCVELRGGAERMAIRPALSACGRKDDAPSVRQPATLGAAS